MKKRVAAVLVGLVLSMAGSTSASAALNDVTYDAKTARNATIFDVSSIVSGESKGSCRIIIRYTRPNRGCGCKTPLPISRIVWSNRKTGGFEVWFKGQVDVRRVTAWNCEPLA